MPRYRSNERDESNGVIWLNGRLSCEQIEQLWCEFIIPEQNKEQKESEE